MNNIELYIAIAGLGILLNVLSVAVVGMIIIDKYTMEEIHRDQRKHTRAPWRILIPFFTVFKYVFYVLPLLRKHDTYSGFLTDALEIK